MAASIQDIPAWVDGVLTPVEKLRVHQLGLKHKAISVFVTCGGKILLQRRALSKYHTPGLWTNTCCTHPYWEEASLDAATRRLDEELGITGLELIHCGEVEYRADVGQDLIEHELVQIYRAEAAPDLAMALNPDEIEAVAWCDLPALEARIRERPEAFTPWLQIYLAQYRDMILPE